MLNYVGAATSLYPFLNASKTSERKCFFPYEWFDDPKRTQQNSTSSLQNLFKKLRNNTPLEKDYSDFQCI